MDFLTTIFRLLPALSLILPSSLLTHAWNTTISPGSGEWKLTISHFELVDSSRVDHCHVPAFSNTTNAAARKIMVTVFVPVTIPDKDGNHTCSKFRNVPYMSPAVAKEANKMFLGDEGVDVFNQAEYNTCCASSGTLWPGNMPVIILEPAVGTSRLLYGGIAQEIASHGLNVFLIDHPGDAAIVEFPAPPGTYATGETVVGNIQLDPFNALKSWNDTVANAIATRKADINFLLTSLANNQSLAAAILPDFKVLSAFDPSKGVGITGHGAIGGSVATALGIERPELFKYAVNLAGTPPKLTSNDTTAYLVFFGMNPGFQRQDDFGWAETWKHLQGRVTEWDLQKADIFDYTDVPKIVDMAGVEKGKVKGLGSVDRLRAFGATAQFVRSYMARTDSEQGAVDLSGLVSYFMPDMMPFGA